MSEIIKQETNYNTNYWSLTVINKDVKIQLSIKQITLNTESGNYAAVHERYSDDVWNYFVLYILNNPMMIQYTTNG